MKGMAIVHFIFRVMIGAGIFWFLYFILNVDNYELMAKIAIIILISTASSLTALTLSYIIIAISLLAMKKQRESFESLSGNNFMVDVIYEMLAIIFNSIAVSIGVVIFLQSQAADFYIFFLFYIGMKVVLRVFAYALAHAIQTHLVAVMFIFTIFLLFCFTAVMILYMNPPNINIDAINFYLDNDQEGSL